MTSGRFPDVLRLLLSILLISSFLGPVAGGCPSVCQCKWRDGKETVTCQDANFIDIPKGLDSSTQVLDLRKNRLIILPKGAFIDTGLVNLQKVWLNHCKLRLLEKGAFEKLANLVELDLSDNFINSVPSGALSDISGIRNLFLARNNLGPLPASIFTSVPSLVKLDVSYNNISSINKNTFRGLNRLEILILSGNILSTLSVNVLKPLVALHGLHVDNNPWHCDCHLRFLRQWLLQRNVAASIPPTCYSPERLNGRRWQTLGEDEFVCVPHVTAVAQRVLAAHGDNVSLACRVETDASAAVTWLVDDKPVINTSAQTDKRYRVLELGAPKSDVRVSNLTIAGAAVQDEGIYRCVAENKAGRVETNLTLQVSHRIKETALIALDKVFVTGALLGSIAFIFIVSVISCAVLYGRNRRTRMSVKVVSSANQPSPELSLSEPNSQQNLRKLNLVDYQVVPTSEASNRYKSDKSLISSRIECETNNDSMTLGKNESDCVTTHPPTSSSSLRNCKSSGLKGISKTVSYVEMPRADYCESDPLLKEIYRETSFIRTTGLTSSQTSLIGYGGSPFPDLLDLPRASQQMGSVDRLPFCTMPRRSKKEESRDDNLPLYPRLPSYERPLHQLYRKPHRLSLRSGEDLIKLRESTFLALGGERIRWSSALSLELSTKSVNSCHAPSLPTTPLTSRMLDARLNQLQQDPLSMDDPDEDTIFDMSNAASDSSRRLLVDNDRQKATLLDSCDKRRSLFEDSNPAAEVEDQLRLIEEIQKLRARKDELAKMRSPDDRPLGKGGARVEGDVTPSTQARHFEYHAQQLDRFLQEYKNLQDQLYKMKESCDTLLIKKGTSKKNRNKPTAASEQKSAKNASSPPSKTSQEFLKLSASPNDVTVTYT